MATDSNMTGVISETAVIHALSKLGYGVSIPIGKERYDLIATKPNEVHRVQVKTARHTDRGYVKVCIINGSIKPYDGSNVDAFAVYDPVTEDVYWMWYDETPDTQVNRLLESWQRHLISDKL